MATWLSLGFGCFQFQISESAPERLTGDQYFDFIRKTLGEISGVSGVKIQCYERLFRSAGLTRPSPIPSFNESGISVPKLEFTEIQFDVHVPRSIQEALAERGEAVSPFLGEKFTVWMEDGWIMPSAMVCPHECESVDDASSAVVLIREFLQDRFAEIRDPKIRFEFMGPSPAHFSVSLTPGEHNQGAEFQRIDRERRGYHHYSFTYGDRGTEPVAIAKRFFERIGSELDLHYRIAVARRQQLQAWQNARSETERIVDAYRRTGFWSPVHRLLQGRRINRALIALAEIELDQRQELQALRTDFDTTCERGGSALVREVVDDALREFKPIPVHPLADLLKLFDARRSTARGVAIATVASLIGALVAAAATLVAAG
jgi:hypothetical protein